MKSKICHNVKQFVMKTKNTSWRQKVRHNMKNISWHPNVCYNIKNTFSLCFVPEIMKTNMSRQKAGHGVKNTSCQQNVATHHDVIEFDITSKSVSCCQKVPWRQNVYHDINKCNIRHSAKTFVTSKMCHVINKSWCYKVRHYVNTRHDDKGFVIT